MQLSATGPMRATSVCVCVCERERERETLILRCGVYRLISQCSLCLCVWEFGENLLCHCLQLDKCVCVCVCLCVSVCGCVCQRESILGCSAAGSVCSGSGAVL